MVSNANDDFPDPDRPVITVSEFLGISRLIFLRLFCLAPRTMSLVRPMVYASPSTGAPAPSKHTEGRITFNHSRRCSHGSTLRLEVSNVPAHRLTKNGIQDLPYK